ncbi:uncharacterized protein LOC120667887 [Panicum virgatum]|uniref:uncharacterized protein LOC120667887 n=1 Tax=Panicum virgatum TaxID=38727 RepID=UPI0019D5AE64|nr:uncharacterized protein LOC120667887 [Panicum virgatum]
MRLSKVLMDGGSSLNILYIYTLETMGIPWACLQASLFPFYGILPDWKGAYHAVLGCPAYAEFMAVSNYTYLKLKLTGPNRVIIVSSSFEQAYASSREHFDLATTAANSAELSQLRTTTA